jgi:hypothetical protein
VADGFARIDAAAGVRLVSRKAASPGTSASTTVTATAAWRRLPGSLRRRTSNLSRWPLIVVRSDSSKRNSVKRQAF